MRLMTPIASSLTGIRQRRPTSDEIPGIAAAPKGVGQQTQQRQRHQQRDRPEVADGGVAERESSEPFAETRAIPEVLFEREAPARDQVEADVMLAIGVRPFVAGTRRMVQGTAADLNLGDSGTPCEQLDRAAIPIAGRKIHLRVRA